jgi:hypothetical protein
VRLIARYPTVHPKSALLPGPASIICRFTTRRDPTAYAELLRLKNGPEHQRIRAAIALIISYRTYGASGTWWSNDTTLGRVERPGDWAFEPVVCKLSDMAVHQTISPIFEYSRLATQVSVRLTLGWQTPIDLLADGSSKSPERRDD